MNIDDDDALVVERVLAGDVEAFRELVDRYGDRLYRFCMARLGDASDAEDAVQDVLVRAFRSLRSYDSRRSWSSWLFAIAANLVKSRYASRVSSSELADAAGREAALTVSETAEAENPERVVLDRLASQALRDAVASLAPAYRAPVELYYFAGLGVSDVAATLGLGDEAVKSRLFRARKILYRSLDDSAQPTRGVKGKRQ